MITLVSVTYNAERTLPRTLQSVECQTNADIEHIIMDGASKDDTVALANAYKERVANRYPVTIVSEKDHGLYDAMNKALKLAKGDYICFLNAGDKLHAPDTIQQVAAVADEAHVGIIYGETDIVDEGGKFLRTRRLTPPEHLTWRSFIEGMLVCHQSFYANRSIAQTYDLTYRFSADFDWCIRCMKQAKKQGLTNIPVTTGSQHAHSGRLAVLTDYLSEGMTTANHKASLKERFCIMARHYGLTKTIIQHIWFIFRALLKR